MSINNTSKTNISEKDLRSGDIILTGGFQFDKGHGNVANIIVRELTSSRFGHAMLYIGNGMIVQQGGEKKLPLKSALIGISYAIVLRPRYLHASRAGIVVEKALALSQKPYAVVDSVLSLVHHPKAIRFYHKHSHKQFRKGYHGHKYKSEPNALDCSGLIFEAYRQAGFSLGNIDPWPQLAQGF